MFVLCTLACTPACAADFTAEQIPVPPVLPNVSNPDDVAAFFDAVVPAGMAKYNVPGATVSVVSDGDLVYAKGYGYADIETDTPVDPEKTLFHIGSATKLFTWTAVMQQVEKGTIDLDADINTYLKDFSIPETYQGQPVTMRHLMTHTAGFEESEVHFRVAEREDLYSYRIYCEENIPAIVHPPGTVTSYSNYGATLAGVILEDVTGVPYAEYVRENILTPLGMTNTIVSYPKAPEKDAETASGYQSDGVVNSAVPDLVVVIDPAGSISSPATDMAKFLAMHMEEGTLNGAEVLGQDTARLMHAPAFANDPRVSSSMCLGFFEYHIGDERIIAHDGDTLTFHSLLAIIPERQSGFFVSYNGAGGIGAGCDLLMEFVDYFYPGQETEAPADMGVSPSSVDTFTGTYQSNRQNYRTFEFFKSPPQQIQIKAGGDDGTILGSGGSTVYREIERGVFSRADGKETFLGNNVFRENDAGAVDFLCFDNMATVAYERVPWYATEPFTEGVKNAGVLILLTVLLWPLQAIYRRIYSTTDLGDESKEPENSGPEQSTNLPQYSRLITGAAALIFLSFVLIILPAVMGDSALLLAYQYDRTTPFALTAALFVPVIASVLSVVGALFLIPVWKKRYWTRMNRMHYTIIIVGLFMMIWWANFWNLFFFRL